MKIPGIVPIAPESVLSAAQSPVENIVQTLCIMAFMGFIVWSVKLVFE